MTSLICASSITSLNGGINESPFSIQVFRFSSVTLLPLTLNVPRLFNPFRPGPIFLASLVSKWQTLHFCWKTSLPRAIAAVSLAPPEAAFLLLEDFDCEDCPRSTLEQASRDAIPKSATVRFTFLSRRLRCFARYFGCFFQKLP